MANKPGNIEIFNAGNIAYFAISRALPISSTEGSDPSVEDMLGHSLLDASNEDCDFRSGPVLPEIAHLYRTARWRVCKETSKIFKSAGIVTSIKIEGRRNLTPEATFHSLRHTFVSLAANAGVPLHIVQSIVGQESTAMTRHYYHENVDSLRMAVNAIPVLE